MSSAIAEINLENAQALLIEESFQRPVVIDFWAAWCGPCKSLMPILEQLATDYQGQFLLAKVNADDLGMIAGQFGVRSLPTVVLMKDGQPVDGFTGLKPEAEIRQMLDKYLPKEWDRQLEEARKLLADEQWDAAYTLLIEAQQASNQQPDITLALAETRIKMKRFTEAEESLAQIKIADRNSAYERLQAELQLAREAQKAPEIEALEQRHAAAPEDWDVAFQLAIQYSQHEYRKEALQLLYDIIRQDMNFKSGEAKRIYLDILALLGKSDPLASEYQRKLYALLY